MIKTELRMGDGIGQRAWRTRTPLWGQERTVVVTFNPRNTGERPMTESTKPLSPLRQRVIEDMTFRKLSPKAETHYIRAVRNLTRYRRRSPMAVTSG